MPLGNVTLTAKAGKTINSYVYTVEYYYDGVQDTTKTEILTSQYLSSVETYKDKCIKGYELNKTESIPLIISATPSNNVIKVYYKAITYNLIYILNGGTIGISNYGGLRFYAGIISDTTGSSIIGKNPEIESGYSIIKTTIENREEATLQLIE